MRIQLISQIDAEHWTVLFLDGKWQGKKGDYRLIIHSNVGDKLEVDVLPYQRRPEPVTIGYCGVLTTKGKT